MLPKSGTMSMSQLATEFEHTLPKSFGAYYGIVSGIPASGSMSLSQFYAKYRTLADAQAYLFDTSSSLSSFLAAANKPPLMADVSTKWGRFSGNAWFPPGTTPTGDAAAWGYTQGAATTVDTKKQLFPLFGVKAEGIKTAAQVTSQLVTELGTGNQVLTVTSDGTVMGYLCYPVEFGLATFVDQSTGIAGGWDGATWPNGDMGDTTGPLTISRTIGKTTSNWYLYRMDFAAQGTFKFNLTFANPNTVVEATVSQSTYADGTIKTTADTATTIGLLSPEALDYYDFSATLSSTDVDDDTIGLVAAFANDGTTSTYLMALRSNQSSNTWSVVLVSGNTSTTIANVNLGATTAGKPNPTYNGWADSGATRIRINRQGDLVKFTCSRFGSESINTSTLIQINLSSNAQYAPLRGKKLFGFCANSQLNATFNNVKLFSNLLSDTVYDLSVSTNNQQRFDGLFWALSTVTPASIATALGYPRTVTNPATGYKFFIDPDGNIARI